MFSTVQGCDKSSQCVTVLVFIVFHVAAKKFFSKIVFYVQQRQPLVTDCRAVFLTSALQSCSNTATLSAPLSTKVFIGLYSFVIKVEKALTVSFDSFFFFPFASVVQPNKSRRTSNYLAPFLFSPRLSTFVKSIHHFLFLNLAIASILLYLFIDNVFFCTAILWLQHVSHLCYW